MIVLDTHVLVWLAEGDTSLGTRARKLADQALLDDELAVSAISFWEIALLQNRGRLQLVQPLVTWRTRLLSWGLTEIPITGDIGIAANTLAKFHKDPADRLITASAILNGAFILTADKRILQWSGKVRKINARR